MPDKDIATTKTCLDCDTKNTWDKWFCIKCGGRLTYAKRETPRVARGKNNILILMSNRPEPFYIDLPPNERVLITKGDIKKIPIANDDNVFIRFLEDGTVLVGAKMYAEED